MDIILLLTETRNITAGYFDLPANELFKQYAPGKWSIKKILVHLADAESVLHERIKRTIAEPKPVLWAFDQDRWSTHLNYESFPLEISKSLYLANRNSIIYLAENYYSKQGSIEFVHSETGIRTLKDEFDKVAAHNQSHINQIKTALLTN